MMKALTQEAITDAEFRKAALKDMQDGQAKDRKAEHTRRREVYNDRTKEYVLRQLQVEMGKDTASEMQHRTPNLNITRKIIDKKARVYKDRPFRKAESEAEQEKLDAAVEALRLDSTMKRVNAGVELHKNLFVMVLPFMDKVTGKWSATPNILDPSRYDVIEDLDNPARPLAVITSYYSDQGAFLSDYRTGDATPGVIAQPQADKGKEERQYFVWWSDKYHFTTDSEGVIVRAASEDLANPFGQQPGAHFRKGDSESYWVDGGEGAVDNAILFNMLFADMNYSAKYQSIGIGWVRGKGPLTAINVGPSRFVQMAYEEGDPVPDLGFATPSPALGDNMAILEQFLSMFLTSEGLEPGSMSGKLEAGQAQSGVQEIIQRSEPTSILEDEQQLYKDAEPLLIRALVRLVESFGSPALLTEELAAISGLPAECEYDLTFRTPAPFTSERERLEMFALKEATGFYSDDELMEYLFPELDAEARTAKLADVQKRRAEKAAKAMEIAEPKEDDKGLKDK